jgi:ABC-type transport system involved in multi-copper enzyme maturation permease subunit
MPVAKKGVIHDLGYARYSGERRPPSTLWRVIMRQHLAFAWKTTWRLKPWIILALIITAIFGVILGISKGSAMGMMAAAAGKDGPTWLVATIPYAYKFFRIPAFLITMTIGAAIIARDREIGAFTFYFSRPVRSLDYVVGKLAGQLVLIALIFLAGPLLLSIASVAMANDTTEMVKQLWIIPKTLAIGTFATFAYATVPLAFSAVSPRRTIALTFWAGYYIMVSNIISGLGSLLWRPLQAFDLAQAMDSLAMNLFDVKFRGEKLVPLWAAVGSLTVQTVIAIVVVARMVQREAEGSVGGSG